ncbi:MAG: family N-acetyltransferase [Solirubrobacterales bacterium]|nr:family N-acetyltransferase [Solirubrobacterales bacterium]
MPGPGDLTLRPLVPEDVDELRRIRATPEVARWWDLPEAGFPLSDDPESKRRAIVVAGRVVGLIQYAEELEPRYRHASIDLFLDPAVHGRGIGTEAVRRVAHELIERHGHHRITIDPATTNFAAIRAYEKAGFRRVGIMRAYERDPVGEQWHDGLLMELLSSDVERDVRG